MTDSTAEFFADLGRSGHDARLEKARGSLRFDVVNGQQWLVTVDKGDIAVSHAKRKADCVVRADKRLVDGLVSGRQNAFTAVLRGELVAEGDMELLVLFQRLFPGPQA
jgi:predicted lipid carrier protein YhbT